MYICNLSEEMEFILNNFKDSKSRANLIKKMRDVVRVVSINPNHFKNLNKPLNKFKRVHINNSFVLVFEVDILKEEVTFVDYDHHDIIYKKRNLMEY